MAASTRKTPPDMYIAYKQLIRNSQTDNCLQMGEDLKTLYFVPCIEDENAQKFNYVFTKNSGQIRPFNGPTLCAAFNNYQRNAAVQLVPCNTFTGSWDY